MAPGKLGEWQLNVFRRQASTAEYCSSAAVFYLQTKRGSYPRDEVNVNTISAP